MRFELEWDVHSLQSIDRRNEENTCIVSMMSLHER